MANTALAYKWNNGQVASQAFSFTTRYYDLGDASLMKNLYKISLSFGVDSADNLESNSPLILNVLYRINQGTDFIHYGTYYSGTAMYYIASSGNRPTNVSVKNKLTNIPGIQLQVSASIPEKFLINDISIEYRQLRRKAVGSPQ